MKNNTGLYFAGGFALLLIGGLCAYAYYLDQQQKQFRAITLRQNNHLQQLYTQNNFLHQQNQTLNQRVNFLEKYMTTPEPVLEMSEPMATEKVTKEKKIRKIGYKAPRKKMIA